MPKILLGRVLSAGAALGFAVGMPASPAVGMPATPAPGNALAPPPVVVEVVQNALDIPWDLVFTDATHYLLNERAGRLWFASTDPAVPRAPVIADFSDLNVRTSGGLLGMAIDPDFATNRLFYTCQTHRGPDDVRVVRWRLSLDGRRATRVRLPVVSGIPFGSPHFGCRLLILPDGTMLIGTGDAAQASAPQRLDSLAGKVLRVRLDGSIPADNPWAGASGPRRYVWNYGHRNIQGLALRPGTSQVFNAEHGPEWDDEVNLVLKGRNYGWNPRNPAGGTAYYQNVPMTDRVKYPNAVPAAWKSGTPTLATSGLEFVKGSSWGAYRGRAFVALLKDAGVLSLAFDAAGRVVRSDQVPELDDTHGRIRTIRQAPDGSVYVLTANGVADQVLRGRPSP